MPTSNASTDPRAVLRPATPDDISTLAQLGRQTFFETFAADNDATDMAAYVDTAFSTDNIRQEIETPGSDLLVLWLDGTPAGYLKLNTGSAQTEDRGPHALEIERIYLLSAFKGRGLGRLLMDHALQTARTAGMSKVWLGVWEQNSAAIEFYRKLGFGVVAEHDFVIGTDVQRDLIMELPL